MVSLSLGGQKELSRGYDRWAESGRVNGIAIQCLLAGCSIHVCDQVYLADLCACPVCPTKMFSDDIFVRLSFFLWSVITREDTFLASWHSLLVKFSYHDGTEKYLIKMNVVNTNSADYIWDYDACKGSIWWPLSLTEKSLSLFHP